MWNSGCERRKISKMNRILNFQALMRLVILLFFNLKVKKLDLPFYDGNLRIHPKSNPQNLKNLTKS